MNNLIKLLLFLFLIGVLTLVFYKYLYYEKKKNYYEIINENEISIDQTYEEMIPLSKLNAPTPYSLIQEGNPQGYGMTIVFELFIQHFQPERTWFSSYAKNKPIIRIGNSPHIYYNPKMNHLSIQVEYLKTPFYAHYPIIEYKNVPLQTWNKFIVVLKTNYVVLYLNGKQVLNKTISNPIKINYSDVIVGEVNNNLIGKMKNMRLYYRPYHQFEIDKL